MIPDAAISVILTVAGAAAAAIFSASAGVLAGWVSKRFRRDRKSAVEDIEKIARVARADEEARRLAAVEKLLEKLPDQTSVERASAILSQLGSAVPKSVAGEIESPAVESLISGYHEQALSQANAQFWFSVAAATVGFAWILYAGMEIKAENLVTAFKTLPGIVMDAVAFLFFKQASETRQRATELYDRLRRDKQSAESVALVAAIEDVRVRSAVQAQIALHMAGMEPAPIDLGKFLSAPISHEPARPKLMTSIVGLAPTAEEGAVKP
jgi:hypothetical protein